MSNRYEESLCFRLHKVKGLSVSEISKETGLSEDTVRLRITDYDNRLKGVPSKLTGNHLHTGFIADDKLAKSTMYISNAVLDGDSSYQRTLGIIPNAITDKHEGVKLDDMLEDTLRTEEEYFTIPDGRDDSLYLHKDADKQREKISKYIEEKYRGRSIKVLYMADLHIPFTMYDLVKFILKEHGDANILVINGDLLDLFAVSTFAKDKTVALKRELKEGREFLEIVSRLFEEVIVVEGNHERRLRNYIKNVIPIDMHFLFPQDVLQVMQLGSVFELNPLDNVHVVGSWWIKIYDTIFAHPDNYNSPPMRTVINTSEHFALVKNIPHRAVVIGHTHQAGKYIDRNRMLMETGCLCYDMDYKNGSKFDKTTWTRAHAVIYFDEHNQVLFNDSQVTVFSV